MKSSPTAGAPTTLRGATSRSVAWARSPLGVVVLSALALRLVAGWLYFGSVDISNAMGTSPQFANSEYPQALPYLTGIPLTWWVGEIVLQVAPFTGTLALKAGALFADALLVLPVYWIQRIRRGDLSALSAAWLYAVNPVSILIVCFHGQFDSLLLLPIAISLAILLAGSEARRTDLVSGALAGLAGVFKPIGWAFGAFLLPAGLWSRADWRRAGRFMASAVVAAAVGLAPLLVLSTPFRETLVNAWDYALRPFGVFGLFKVTEFGPAVEYLRYFSLASLAVLLWAVYSGRLSRVGGLASFMLLTLMWGPTSPQYLLWPVPFLLMLDRRWIGITYSSVVGTLLVAYYSYSNVSIIPGENAGAVVARGPFQQWIGGTPLSASQDVESLLRFSLNVALPAMCAVLAVATIVTERSASPPRARSVRGVGQAATKLGSVFVCCIGAIAAGYCVFARPMYELLGVGADSGSRYTANFAVTWSQEVLAYVSAEPGGHGYLFALGALLFGWAVAVILILRRQPSPVTRRGR